LFAQGVTELGCLAHARRKFFDLHAASGSPIALEALSQIAALYAIEKQGNDMAVAARTQLRQDETRPLLQSMHAWLLKTRVTVANGGGTAKAIDYSLNHWVGFGRYLLDGDVPIDNNYVENRMRPWALGRRNWLFIGSQLAGQRAAVVMSLLQSAKLNGHEPWTYLKDVLTRLPTQLNSRIEELLPHRWQPAG